MKTTIFNCYTTAQSDDDFIDQLNKLAALEGELVYQTLFVILIDLHLEPAEAKQRWLAILNHRALLTQTLGRDFALFSALCDYFSHQSSYLKYPKLTDIAVHNRITQEAYSDGLTGLLNKNNFQSILNQQMALAERHQGDLSLLFADIDDFKLINDTFGHSVGDNVLQQTGKLIQQSIRKSDIAFRYGGEEFVIIMPDTNSVDALLLVNRLRLSIHQQQLRANRQKIKISVSCGIASFPSHAKNAEDLIRFADNAMYQAKGAGKNKVCLFEEENRRYLRIPLSQHIQIKTLGFNSTKTHNATCRDIGIGGILFENKEMIPIGTNIQIDIKLIEQQPLLLIGTVIRVELISNDIFGIGVALTLNEMDIKVKKEISQLLISARSGCIAS